MEESLQVLFHSYFREPADTVSVMKGDGSDRKLLRLKNARHSAIGVINADPLENKAFIEFSRHFRQAGLPVPEIYIADENKGIYLEEDLGETNLFQYLTAHRAREGLSGGVLDLYRASVRLLPQFQVQAGRTLDYKLCHPRASFDKQSMLWDLNYFKYYFLRLGKIPFGEQSLEDDFERFSDFLLEADRDFFLYRDFQSRNIMVKDNKPWFIDYQGGRKGALQYDIASLLFDAKADLPFEVRDELLELYIESASALISLDRARFLKYYPGYVYIRIMQALGAYGLRGFYERKTHFLQSIPYAIRNLEYILRRTELPVELPALMQVFKALVASSRLRQFGEAALRLTVRVQSFSFRETMPMDEKGHGGGYVFDCRALPNPGKQEQYAKLTGLDPEVAAFLDKEPSVGRFLKNVFELVDASVENYQGRNFTDLMVSFGCTGGRHRSVYCADRLARHLRGSGIHVELRHREQEKETADGLA